MRTPGKTCKINTTIQTVHVYSSGGAFKGYELFVTILVRILHRARSPPTLELQNTLALRQCETRPRGHLPTFLFSRRYVSNKT